MTPARVFDGEHLRAVLWPGRAGRLVVTFDWRQDGRDGFLPDDHATPFARQGFPQLCLRTRANDWFVNPDTAALESALPGIVGPFARRQALGFSMGGYGALRFAAALGLAQAVVVSPQLSPRAPWDARYRAEAPGWDDGPGAIPPHPRLRGLLVHDPFVPEDRAHARAIMAAFPRLASLPLPFGGHPAIATLRAGGGMPAVYAAAGAPGPRPGPIRDAHRAARRASPGWWLRLAARADHGHPRLAARARAIAGALPPRPGDGPGA